MLCSARSACWMVLVVIDPTCQPGVNEGTQCKDASEHCEDQQQVKEFYAHAGFAFPLLLGGVGVVLPADR